VTGAAEQIRALIVCRIAACVLHHRVLSSVKTLQVRHIYASF